MMSPMIRSVLVTIALGSPALAQTGPALLLEPWPSAPEGAAPTFTELDFGTRYHFDADVDDTDDELAIWTFTSSGRHRTNVNEPGALLGYEVLHLDLDTGDDALPERLFDGSIGAGFTTGELDADGRWGFATGVGYAGDAPFGETDAIYFLGNITHERPLDDRSWLTFALSYDGNRTIWPDVPLPTVSYSRRVSDQFFYTVGLPATRIRWQPDPAWTIVASYYVLTDFELLVEYTLTEQWHLFGQLESDRHAFVVDGDEDRRLFFQQRRLEAGVRYLLDEHVNVVLAGGYAFDQEFETGWDVRDLDEVREIDDAPFIRAAVSLRF